MTVKRPQCIIIAGVNGVGKSTFYSRTSQNIDFNILLLYDWFPQEADIFSDYL